MESAGGDIFHHLRIFFVEEESEIKKRKNIFSSDTKGLRRFGTGERRSWHVNCYKN